MSADERVRRKFKELTDVQIEYEFDVVRKPAARPLPAASSGDADAAEHAEPPEETTLEELRRETRQCYAAMSGEVVLALVIGTGLGVMMLVVYLLTR
mmetsp:Transcript_36844/g.101658  ORF Transcript_36844/g.101658 Transcript_36844/m.101658 type:complete len:97 (-) Transcript_36844:106-396(-)|eukprot:7319298-Prymnesium_polylepis.1